MGAEKYWYITYEWTTKDGRTVKTDCTHQGSMFKWINNYIVDNPDNFKLINNTEISASEFKALKDVVG